MANRNVSITNQRVLDAYDEAVKQRKGARLVEEAILFYLDNIEDEPISKEVVQGMIIDALKNVTVAPISNQNYTQETAGIKSIIDDIMGDMI